MTRTAGPAVLGVLLAALVVAAPPDDGPAPLLARIRAVKNEGQGNEDAAAAWKQLVGQGPAALLPALAALTDKEPLAANWLRAAIDAIGEKTLAANKPLPAKELEAFVKDRKNSGVARRLAYEWLCRADAQAPDRL